MVGDELEQLGRGEPQPLRDWLAGHGADPERLWRLPRWNTEDERAPESSMRRHTRRQQVIEELSAQFPRAAAQGCAVEFLLYVHYEVAEAWEISYHFGPLWDTLRGTREYLAAHRDLVTGHEAVAVDAALALMEYQDQAILAENAMTCAMNDAHARAAQAAGDSVRAAGRLAASVASAMPAFSAYVTGLAANRAVYYDAVAGAARGLAAFMETGAPLDGAVAALAAGEADPCLAGDHRYVSGLRAHRFHLAALDDAGRTGWLRVDHGRIVYIHPFALRGITPEKAVRRAGREADGWLLGGVPPAQVHRSLDLDDIWDGADPLGRRYDGALIELPDVTIEYLDGERIGTVGAQLRLSDLGNHYVRFEAELVDATPAEVHAMMFRAAPEFGMCRLAFAGGPDRPAVPVSSPRLSDLAVRLTEDVCELLRRDEADTGTRVVTRPGMFHVVVSVHAASRTPRPGEPGTGEEMRSVGDFTGAVGSPVLTNPVNHEVGSVAEWIRYTHRHDLSQEIVTLADGRIVRTCNSTLLLALGAPMFSMGTRETMGEFVASLDGLFAGWSSELAEHYRSVQRLQARLPGVGEEDRMGADELRELAEGLEREKKRLHDFALESRSTVNLIRSPSLVSSPVAAAVLERLLGTSDFGRRADELDAAIEEVLDERLALSIEKLARQRAERRSRQEARVRQRQRAKMDTLLAVIAAIGVSGLGQILQAGYGMEERGAAVIVGAIVVLAVLVGGFFWWSAGDSERFGDDSG